MTQNDLEHIFNLFSEWVKHQKKHPETKTSSSDNEKYLSELYGIMLPCLVNNFRAKARALQLPEEEGVDTAQNVLTKLLTHVQNGTFEPKSPCEFFSWLLIVGTNELLTTQRRHSHFRAPNEPCDPLSLLISEATETNFLDQAIEKKELIFLISNILSEEEFFVFIRYLRLQEGRWEEGKKPTYETLARELNEIKRLKGERSRTVTVVDIDHLLQSAGDKLVPLGIRLAKGYDLHICPEPRSLSGAKSTTIQKFECYKTSPPRRKICSYGHSIKDFQFDWGEDRKGEWGKETQAHLWPSEGVYVVQVRCRCTEGAISSWYGNVKVTVTKGES